MYFCMNAVVRMYIWKYICAYTYYTRYYRRKVKLRDTMYAKTSIINWCSAAWAALSECFLFPSEWWTTKVTSSSSSAAQVLAIIPPVHLRRHTVGVVVCPPAALHTDLLRWWWLLIATSRCSYSSEYFLLSCMYSAAADGRSCKTKSISEYIGHHIAQIV